MSFIVASPSPTHLVTMQHEFYSGVTLTNTPGDQHEFYSGPTHLVTMQHEFYSGVTLTNIPGDHTA